MTFDFNASYLDSHKYKVEGTGSSQVYGDTALTIAGTVHGSILVTYLEPQNSVFPPIETFVAEIKNLSEQVMYQLCVSNLCEKVDSIYNGFIITLDFLMLMHRLKVSGVLRFKTLREDHLR